MKKKPSTLSRPQKQSKSHLMVWIAVIFVFVIAVSGIIIVRLSEASSKVYTIGELDNIYLSLRDNPRRIGPYPDPNSPKGREIIKYRQNNSTDGWYAGCFVALTPEGARVLSFKFGDSAHFSTRRWIQTACQ